MLTDNQRNGVILTVIIVFSALMAVVREFVLPEVDWGFHLLDFSVSTILMVVVWQFVERVHYTLNKRLPFERYFWRRILMQLVISKLFTLIIFSIGAGTLLGLIPHLSDHLTPPARFLLLLVTVLTVGIINVILIAEDFLYRWRDNAVRAARLEQEKAQVQFDNLKNQLNPHFLFNSLSSLDGLIHENPALASQFLRQLSKVFRYVLQHKDKDLVSVGTECDFLKNYISLLKTRFDGALHIEMTIEGDAADREIVPLTMQSLVENAIKHNIADAAHPLHVRIYTADAFLTVENNLQRKPNVETSNQQGLKNLQALYRFLTAQPIQIDEQPGRFRVSIPLIS